VACEERLLGGEEHADVTGGRVEGAHDGDREEGEERGDREKAQSRRDHEGAGAEQEGAEADPHAGEADDERQRGRADQGAGDDDADLQRREADRPEVVGEQDAHEPVGKAAQGPNEHHAASVGGHPSPGWAGHTEQARWAPGSRHDHVPHPLTLGPAARQAEVMRAATSWAQSR
jgi:hypothetical protein